jgi:pSer/pThr/pTyr-binding forkhead associated (FHA) protein
MGKLSRLEKRLSSLIEGNIARLFMGRIRAHEVAIAMARAMDEQAWRGDQNIPIAPDAYLVKLHPDDLAALQASTPDLDERLSESLIDLVTRAEMGLDQPPTVTLAADPDVMPFSIVVVASHTNRPPIIQESTERLEVPASILSAGTANLPADAESATLPEAHLILNGTQHIALNRPVINIGRSPDNHIILGDPRVSRHHAQIRSRFGRFSVFDLNSKAGTFVNDVAISESVLRTGDVITFACVQAIYVEDEQHPTTPTDRIERHGP